MRKAFLRFYEELNDFLPPAIRKREFEHSFLGNPSVKDLIESLGVPHTEIDLILVNSVSVGFEYRVMDEDRISVYPVFESMNISEAQHLRPAPLRNPKFAVDEHLGKLAKLLRMVGFDTFYEKRIDDSVLVRTAINELRTLLTRDREILKRKEVTRGYFVRSKNPTEQLSEVIERFDLRNCLEPFTRCLLCNSILIRIQKPEVDAELPESVRKFQKTVNKCTNCGKLYWQGTHYNNMSEIIQKL